MKKGWIILILVSILLMASTRSEESSVIQPQVLENLEQQQEVPVIIQLETLSSNISKIEETTNTNLNHLSGNEYTARIDQKGLQTLANNPNVVSIKEDEVFHILLAESVPLINASIIQARQFGTINITGTGQSICVIDTGINATHGAFTGRVVAQKCFCAVSDHGSGGCCPDGKVESSTATDDNKHGTHVAGIAAGNGESVLGVAPGAGLVIVKVADSAGNALFSDITSAVNWCASNSSLYNISVITMSLGGGSYSSSCDSSYTSLSSEITTAINKNISVIAASGNSGSTTNMTSPACISNVISVSSTDKSDAISSFSNRNALTDVFAPGGSITSAYYLGGTISLSGTSMSAPHIAGVIALMQQYKTLVEGRNLTVAEINATLGTNGTTINDNDGSGRSFIRVDARKDIGAIDTIFPLLINPNTTQTSLFIYNNITFIANVTDVNREQVWIEGNWSGNTTNYTMGQQTGDLFNFTLGNNSFSASQVFQWRVHTNDTHNNENISTWFTATILTGAPRITLNSPSDNTYSNNFSVTFNATPIDDVLGNFNCSLYINSILNQTKTTSNNTLTEYRLNLSEGTQLWNVRCTDSDNLIGNSSLYTLILDGTKPLYNGEGYTTNVELGDNQSYSLNITESYISYVNFSYLATNYTLTNSSTNFSRNFMTFSNGTQNFTTYILDLAGNLNISTGNFTVNDTIAGPRILNTIYNTSITQGATLNIVTWILNGLPISSALINVNGSNITMSNNTQYNFTYSFTVSGCGSSSFKIFSNDTTDSGVTNTSTYTVTGCCGDGSCSSGESCSSCATDCGACVSGSSSGGGGGGGGSGGGGSSSVSPSSPKVLAPSIESAPTNITQTIATASPTVPIEIYLNSTGIAVDKLFIVVKSTLQNIGITVEALRGKPEEIEAPKGIIYQYLSFTTTNLQAADINSTEIEFYIPNIWFIENGVDKNSIKLLHYEGEWQELPTTALGLKNSNYYYSAISTSFSYYAISGEKSTGPENITKEAETQTQSPGTKTNWTKYIIISLIIILSLFIIIIFFVWFERKREQSKI